MTNHLSRRGVLQGFGLLAGAAVTGNGFLENCSFAATGRLDSIEKIRIVNEHGAIDNNILITNVRDGVAQTWQNPFQWSREGRAEVLSWGKGLCCRRQGWDSLIALGGIYSIGDFRGPLAVVHVFGDKKILIFNGHAALPPIAEATFTNKDGHFVTNGLNAVPGADNLQRTISFRDACYLKKPWGGSWHSQNGAGPLLKFEHSVGITIPAERIRHFLPSDGTKFEIPGQGDIILNEIRFLSEGLFLRGRYSVRRGKVSGNIKLSMECAVKGGRFSIARIKIHKMDCSVPTPFVDLEGETEKQANTPEMLRNVSAEFQAFIDSKASGFFTDHIDVSFRPEDVVMTYHAS